MVFLVSLCFFYYIGGVVVEFNNFHINTEFLQTEEPKPSEEPKPLEESKPSSGFSIDKNAVMQLPEEPVKSETTNMTKEVFEWLEVIVTAMVAVVLIFSLLFRVATIQGPSMMNTLHNGEKVIISNFNYTPERGDIVVISRNTSNTVADELTSDLPIIKRVIGVGGDTIDIDFERGIVIVNGQELDEPYARVPTTQKKDIDFPVYVPEGYIFVLGDNRGDSLDSRSSLIGENGMINSRYVLGHAVFRIFPFNKIGGL